VCKYAQEYFALADLKYRLEVPPDLPTTPISPELRHNMFLAAKESVNNVVKHADATKTEITLKRSGPELLITVADNGKGIPKPSGGERNGFGLVGIAERARLLGGSCAVDSIPGQGTTLKLALTVDGNR